MFCSILAVAAAMLVDSPHIVLAQTAGSAKCGAGGGAFLCGLHNPEDMDQVPGTDLVIASSASSPAAKSEGLYLINIASGNVETIDPGKLEAKVDPQFAGCPGQPAPSSFDGHGLYIGDNPLRLYAVNHGDRESIEIFDIEKGSKKKQPTLRWAGCLLAPANVQINGVVALPEGGIAITKSHDGRDPPQRWLPDLMFGEPSGYVLEWHPKAGWHKVADSAVSGSNGLAISLDGKTYFIAAWGDQRLVRLSRGSEPVRRDSIDLGIHLDNLRWDSEGNLLTVGQLFAGREQAVMQCLGSTAASCPVPYRVVKIDPKTLHTEILSPETEGGAFTGGSVAIDVGTERWIGTFRGDRIIRIKK
ncbi:hypothetical protein C1T17_12345 [Sphingobium sp. SCG-1]|nr:hypothetical protein C1T17_12345 [Sphingobium sp. SCG-1]